MSFKAGSDEVSRVGIAIGITGTEQYHLGILHRGSDSAEVQMLHLKWHHKLRNEAPTVDYLWLKPGINPRRLKHLAAKCRSVWKRNKKNGIPFGFSAPSDSFHNDTGQYLFGPTQYGLTCTTFVLGVFDSAGLKLVDYRSWPVNRPGDSEWQSFIAESLTKTGAEQDHIDTVSSDIGVARFRPEEVAGASLENRIPVEFEVAVRQGGEVLDRLHAN